MTLTAVALALLSVLWMIGLLSVTLMLPMWVLAVVMLGRSGALRHDRRSDRKRDRGNKIFHVNLLEMSVSRSSGDSGWGRLGFRYNAGKGEER